MGPREKRLGRFRSTCLPLPTSPAMSPLPSQTSCPYHSPPADQSTASRPPGASSACLPAYFEASDAYRQRLENEIGYLTGKTSSAQGVISQTNDRSDVVDRETLRA